MQQAQRSPIGGEPIKENHRGRQHRVRRLLGHAWFRVFAAGFALLVLLELSFLMGKIPNLVPAMLIYGAFLVPVSLIAYLYETLPSGEVPLSMLGICLLAGGAIGVSVAAPLEVHLLPPLGKFQYLLVGLIEESSKLILPLVVFSLVAFRSVAAGVIVGFASAMGFSSLESAGYGFGAFFRNYGASDADTLSNVLTNVWSLPIMDITFVSRALTDPIGHGTWTALVCYVIFRERARAGRFVLNLRVASAFLLAVLLHAAWDTSLLITPSGTYEYLAVRGAFVLTLIFTFWLFLRIVRLARGEDKDDGRERHEPKREARQGSKPQEFASG